MSLLNTNKNLLQKPIKSIKKPLSAMKIDWKCFTFDFYPFSLCFNPISFSEWPDRLRTMKLLNILSFESGTYPTRNYIFWWICATCRCSILRKPLCYQARDLVLSSCRGNTIITIGKWLPDNTEAIAGSSTMTVALIDHHWWYDLRVPSR